MTPHERSRLIVETAKELGFHRVGIVPVEPPRRYEQYQAWLRDGMHGSMAYMAAPEHQRSRKDLREVLKGAKTLVVVALAYAKPDPVQVGDGPHGFVARYARGDDYHHVLKEKLYAMAERLGATMARPCVDSAPVLERELAERSGLGFVAKNTMLIAPGLGSYVVLGELLLTEEALATQDIPATPRCGDCTACLSACPTGAFADPFVLDARRCISYWTIEAQGPIPADIREKMGNMIFGCDICQEVCPFNAKAPDRNEPAPELSPREQGVASRPLLELLEMGSNQRKKLLAGTALRRVNRAQFLRNVCVALGNSGQPEAAPALARALHDRSPLVRQHAAWALGRLGARAYLQDARDDDPDVAREIAAALSQASR